MFDFSSLNWISLFVAALAAFFVGFLWHGPVFGKQWMKLMKITPQDMEKGKKKMAGKMHWYMIAAFIQQLVVAIVIGLMLQGGLLTVIMALQLAFLLWLGFIVTTLLNGVLWEQRTIPLYLFNIAYQFVNIAVITLIVGLWK